MPEMEENDILGSARASGHPAGRAGGGQPEGPDSRARYIVIPLLRRVGKRRIVPDVEQLMAARERARSKGSHTWAQSCYRRCSRRDGQPHQRVCRRSHPGSRGALPSTSRGRCARPARGDDRRRGPLPRRDGRGQDPLPRLGVGRSNRGPAGRGATLGYLFGHESSSLDAAFMAATGGFSALASHLVKAAPRRRSTPLPSRRATSSSRRPRTSRSRAWSRSPFSARGSRLGPRRCSSSPGRCSCSSCSVGSAGSGVVTTPGASGTASRHRGTVTAARASFPETHLRSGIRIACSPAYREARARPPVRPPGPAHCAAVIPRLRHTCSVAGERFMVMKWIPGAPSARSCCASSVVISTPT